MKLLLKGFSILSLIMGIIFQNVMEYSYNYHNEVSDTSNEQIEKDNVLYTLNGSLTGYAADCPMCNGTLACKRDYNVYKNGVISYDDVTYGSVRIVASSKNLKCGSIISFESNVLNGTTYAIVLDRGVLGSNIDLLVESESYAAKYIGRSNISYNVLREGW